MKVTIFLFLFVFTCFIKMEPEINKQEAKNAFLFLNKIRINPIAYQKQFSFLKDIRPTYALKWNDTLARVAEAKALDMANRNYFAHVNPDGYGMNHYIHQAGYTLPAEWIKKPQANYFESCNAGGLSGKQAIEMLIMDEDTPSLGHRIHLLGLDEWSASLVDVGIGYVKTNGKTKFASYTCILIAKHK